MATRVTKKAKEAMKQELKAEGQKKTRAPRKPIVKLPLPEIVINEEYKVKVSKHSYDLFRKQDKSLVEEDLPDDEEVEAGWTCLGHFGKNNWDSIRKEIFNDMALRKLTKAKEMDLNQFSTLCEKITKEIQKLFTSNNDILLDQKKTKK